MHLHHWFHTPNFLTLLYSCSISRDFWASSWKWVPSYIEIFLKLCTNRWIIKAKIRKAMPRLNVSSQGISKTLTHIISNWKLLLKKLSTVALSTRCYHVEYGPFRAANSCFLTYIISHLYRISSTKSYELILIWILVTVAINLNVIAFSVKWLLSTR